MSGGEYNYFYQKINNFLDELKINTKNRQKFAKFLYLEISRICRDIEWCDSGDISDEECEKILEKFVNKYNL